MKLTQSAVGWRVEISPEMAFHFEKMQEAQTFMDLVDAGQKPMQALRNVIELRKENRQPALTGKEGIDQCQT